VINFEPSDDQRALIETVRAFVDRELIPLEPNILRRASEGEPFGLTREENSALQAKAKLSGLWGVDTPEEYGGAGLGWVEQALIHMELNRSFVRFKFGGSAYQQLFDATDEQKANYLIPTLEGDKISCFALSEDGGGSDAHKIRTTAVRRGDDWVINGEKVWITYGNEADWAFVICRTPEEPEGGTTAFLVDRDMGWKSSPIKMMGSIDLASLTFTDVVVPASSQFGEVGAGMKYAMQFIHRNRAVLVPSRQAGSCQRLIEIGLDWASSRRTMGKPLIERENIAFALAECEVELRALKLLTLHASWTYDSGRDPRQAANSVKFFGANAANRIVDRVVQMHGAMGLAQESPVERYYRDLRVERIHDGSDEMQLIGIIKGLAKGAVKPGELW
jgi:acyl-CoA dehydrogenase